MPPRRRRNATPDSKSQETASIPAAALPDAPSDAHGIARLTKKAPRKRSLGLTFAIGGLVGLLLAGLAKNKDMMNIELIQDLRLDALVDVIPAGILQEASDISVLLHPRTTCLSTV